MKRLLQLFLIIVLINCNGYSQTAKPVYVIVHGAWGGGWAFKKVDSLMREKGCIVYRPTLTGQGEKVHLATTAVGLSTHINDVVNTILFEDLHDIILIGHSYGGMVVTGVADSLPGRIKKLIYLDAMVPENGESVVSIQGGVSRFKVTDGFIIPPWLPAGKLPPSDVPHPYKTLTDTLVLRSPMREKIATTYILTVAKGVEPKNDDFAKHADRAKKKNWPIITMEADHNPQWSAPEALVEMFLKAVK
jgi:pimeloyl-ACP methyl ester carboxylesterase